MDQSLFFPRASLSETITPAKSVYSLAWIMGSTLFIALCAQISIPLPWTPVPLAGSTFAVLYAAALLGPRRAISSVGLYLFLGGVGLPFFAGSASGWHILWGATGGYLIGFFPAAWLVGSFSERGWDRDPLTAFLQMFLGSLVILVFGLTLLSVYVPLKQLLTMGLYPFIAGDILKSCLAAGLLPLGWRFLGKN